MGTLAKRHVVKVGILSENSEPTSCKRTSELFTGQNLVIVVISTWHELIVERYNRTHNNYKVSHSLTSDARSSWMLWIGKVHAPGGFTVSSSWSSTPSFQLILSLRDSWSSTPTCKFCRWCASCALHGGRGTGYVLWNRLRSTRNAPFSNVMHGSKRAPHSISDSM